MDGHAVLAAANRVTLAASSLDTLAGTFDVVINATATSLAGTAVRVAGDVLKPGALACDLLYGPAAQGFLDWAQAHGGVEEDALPGLG